MLSIKKLRQFCTDCSLSSLCLPVGLNQQDLKALDALISKRKVINKGETLFNAGADFKHLVAVRSGAFKTIVYQPEGKQNIVDFYLAGELFGFDGIADGKYQVTSAAIETSSICEIPFEQLLTLARNIPTLQRQLVSLISQQTLPNVTLQINNTAEQRLVFFLLELARRFKNSGYSENEFNLPMSREDIANYLGLAPETISRLLRHFQTLGLMQVERRHIALIDLPRLKQICS